MTAGRGIRPDFRDRSVMWRMDAYDADVLGRYLVGMAHGDMIHEDGEALIAAAHALNEGRCPDRQVPCAEPTDDR